MPTHPSTTLKALLIDLGATPGVEVLLPPDAPSQLGMTPRCLQKVLVRAEVAGVLRWRRKRPGPPGEPG